MIREIINSLNVVIERERKKLNIDQNTNSLIVILDSIKPSNNFKGIKTLEASVYLLAGTSNVLLFTTSVTTTLTTINGITSWDILLVPFMEELNKLYLTGTMLKIINNEYTIK